MECDDMRAIIIDNGGDTMKVGFGRDQQPCAILQTQVGKIRTWQCSMGGEYSIIGQEALQEEKRLAIKYSDSEFLQEKLGVKFKYPIEGGMITNWCDMSSLWSHVFYNQLRIQPEEHPVLLTEPSLNTKANREEMADTMFYSHNIPALYISNSTVLSLYGTGRTTGIVLETGHTASNVVPIFHGNVLPHATHRLNVTGSKLTDYLTKCLSEHNPHSFQGQGQTERDNVRHIKEKLSYVSLNYQHDALMTSSSDTLTSSYQLPDGKVICLGNELSRCPEILFQPSLILSNSDPLDTCQPTSPGIHESICSSISKCDIDIRKHMYGNIVLSGGNSLFPGMRERLEKEISLLSPLANKVIAPTERKFLTWIGGANLASLSTFEQIWVTRQQYDESGPMLIHRQMFKSNFEFMNKYNYEFVQLTTNQKYVEYYSEFFRYVFTKILIG